MRRFLQCPGKLRRSKRAVAILDTRGGDPYPPQQPQRIGQDVALASLDLLAGVVTPFTRWGGSLDTLAVQTARGGGLVTPKLAAQPCPQGVVEAHPGAIAPPAAKGVVHGRPRWKVPRQLAPLTAGLEDVEDRIKNWAQAQCARAAQKAFGQQGPEGVPGPVAEVTGVAFPTVFLRMSTTPEEKPSIKPSTGDFPNSFLSPSAALPPSPRDTSRGIAR